MFWGMVFFSLCINAILIVHFNQVVVAAFVLCCIELAFRVFILIASAFNAQSPERSYPIYFYPVIAFCITLDAIYIHVYVNNIEFTTWMRALAIARIIIGVIDAFVMGCIAYDRIKRMEPFLTPEFREALDKAINAVDQEIKRREELNIT